MIETKGNQVNTQWLEVDGRRVRCLQSGDKGPIVMLLHGGALDAADVSYRHVIAPLGAACRIYAPDWPGYGHSDPLPGGWTSADYVAHLGNVMDALGIDRAVLVGISMGGAFAQGFALSNPSRVERLVLINSGFLSRSLPGGLIAGLIIKPVVLNWLIHVIITRSKSLLTAALRSALSDHPEMVTDDLVDELMEVARKPHSGRAFRRWQRQETSWAAAKTPYLTRLSELKMPVVFVHSENDKLVPPSSGKEAQKLVGGSQYILVPGCGHAGPMEAPETFCQILQSLCMGRPIE